MSLKIIGSGFGRTGTKTVCDVLDTLGFGPVHHMTEVFGHPEQVPHWKALVSGEPVDFEKLFEGYVSQVDWPGAWCWEQSMAAFPEAKVLHTERPEEEWWNSFDATIRKRMTTTGIGNAAPHLTDLNGVLKKGFRKFVASDPTDKASVLEAYRRNNEKVRDVVPADRLLVFNVADGWEPLCRFLEVPVPEVPFPHRNQRDEFWKPITGKPDN